MTDLKVKYLFQGQKGQNILNVLLQTLVLLMGGLTRITPSPRTKSIGIFRLVVRYTSSYVSSSISTVVTVSSTSPRIMFRC